MPALALVLMLGGCSATTPRTEAEASYLGYINSYQLQAPAMIMVRDAWVLERTEQSWQRLTQTLQPLPAPLVPTIPGGRSRQEAEKLILEWVQALSTGNQGQHISNSASAHYALLTWLGYGEGRNLTQEQRSRKALTILKQNTSRNAVSDYLTGTIQLTLKPTKALVNLHRSADEGYGPAQALLARLYLGNDGIPRNDEKMRKQLSWLASNSRADFELQQQAKGWLGAMNFYGIGGPVNDKKALNLLQQGTPEPDLLYLQALMLSEGLGGRVSVLANKKSNELLVAATNSGSASAANELALNLLYGRNAELNPRRARDTFLQAAALGSSAAAYNLGLDSLYGHSSPASVTDASLWLERAAAQNQPEAQRSLLYLKLDEQQDFNFADEPVEVIRQDLQAVAAKGDGWSSYALGLLTLRGQGGQANEQLGYAWLNIAVAQGYRPAAELRDAVALQLTRPELNQAQALSQNLFDRIEQVEEVQGGVQS
ncbi:tetratricopeptide repeat protein [Endozoicomonadaceae bacterium StTr2]